MTPRSKSKKGAGATLSVDGVLPLVRSYRPGGGQTATLGEVTDLEDGFHPQRAASELGKDGAESVISIDNFDVNEAARASDTEGISVKPKKQRLRRLKFWRLLRRHKGDKNKEPLTRRQKIKRGLLWLLLAVLIFGAGYFGFKFWQTSHNVFKGGGSSVGLSMCKNIEALKKEGDCRINILLLGIGGPGHDGPDLTDTIMLASIDPINNSVALLSIPRDLWVQIPGYGEQKINAAYAYGKEYSTSKNPEQQQRDGLKLLDETLDPVIGMTINYHVVVDFTAFKDAVDDVGGITVNVPQSELNEPGELYDPTIAWENNNNPVIAKVGLQHMNGAQALLYARSRETSSDFARSQRQRTILVAIAQKVLSLGTFSNPVRVSNLLNSFGQNVFTDLSLGNVSPLYSLASKIPSYDITSLDLASMPGNLVTTGDIDGLSVVEPTAGLYNYSQILPYVRATLRDGELAKENAQVEVYNATSTPGIATQEMSVLQSYGYDVADANSAPNPTDPSQTIVVDMSKGADPYTRHYLETRFNTTAVTSLPSQFGIKPQAGTRFVIILGQDASTTSTTANTAG